MENEEVLKGTPEQAAEGLRLYQEWRDRRAARIARGSVPSFRTARLRRWDAAAGARPSRWKRSRCPLRPGRPGGRKFGRVVHDMLQHAGAGEDVETLAAIWGRRHGATELERAAAAEVWRRRWRTTSWPCLPEPGAIASFR